MAVTPTGGFMLRTPLLPVSTLDALLDGLTSSPEGYDDATVAADIETLAGRVRALLGDAVVREALHVASPALVAALDRWIAGEPSDIPALLRSTVSYVTRMCLRPTPFGLFAGCSAGRVGDGSLTLASRSEYRRATRLDYGFLAGIVSRVESDATARAGLTFFPNGGLYRTAGRLRLAERRVDGGAVRYHRVAVRENEAITTVLDAAAAGATLDDLAKTLIGDEVTFDDARGFVDELVDAQLLVSDLGPSITGADAASELAGALARHDVTRPVATALDRALRATRALDAAGIGAEVADYAEVAAAARVVDPGADPARLVQVDLFKPGDGLGLPEAVAREVARAVEVLHRVQPDGVEDGLTSFREAFARRFEDAWVPLAVALDEEAGVGFGGSGGAHVEGAPLLAPLRAVAEPPAGAAPWGRRDAYLLGLLERATSEGASEIGLTQADVAALAGTSLPLPRAMAATATVTGASADAVRRGEFSLLFRFARGPSGAQMLGRFSHLDASVEALVRGHLAAEEAAEPDAVFAEVVHLPEGRIGNILARPVLRAYEIPFLGASGAPPDARLPLGDLIVSVRGGRVVLRSVRLGKEVLPRLTSAHNYRKGALAVYRFLAALQYQGRSSLVAWQWGALDAARYLPRVVLGNTVLDRARWHLHPGELDGVATATTPAARYAAVQRVLEARSLPPWVVIAEGDNELPADLTTVAGSEVFAHAARRRLPMLLLERYPGPRGLCVEGPEGSYANEIVVPLRTDAPPIASRPGAVTTSAVAPFLPGSEWLYAKLYTGRTTADTVLREVVAPLVATGRETGACDGWFFLRYADGEGGHVRVRLHGDAARLLPLLHLAVAPHVEAGTVARVQVDTYHREVERYGGPEGVVLAERLFEADSDVALAALRVFEGDAAADDRWRFALAGLDRLYDDLGVDAATRRAVVRGWRDDLVVEFGDMGVAAKRLGGRTFRTERGTLAGLLAGTTSSPRLRIGLDLLAARGTAVRDVAAELRALDRRGRLTVPVERLAVSFGHLWVIRMMRGVPRLQELVLCDLLDRLYAARAGGQG